MSEKTRIGFYSEEEAKDIGSSIYLNKKGEEVAVTILSGSDRSINKTHKCVGEVTVFVRRQSLQKLQPNVWHCDF